MEEPQIGRHGTATPMYYYTSIIFSELFRGRAAGR